MILCLGFENEYASLLSIAEKKQGEITLQQFIEQKAQKLAKTNYVEVKNTLNEKIASIPSSKLNPSFSKILVSIVIQLNSDIWYKLLVTFIL